MDIAKRTCSIPGCESPTVGRGWCRSHYARWHRSGDPVKRSRRPRAYPPLKDRFWAKVDRRDPDGCWLWRGSKDAKGYGAIRVSPLVCARAHRVSYELMIGPIPEGLQLDHLCFNTSCVNPAHLEPVTNAENMRRRGARTTHCPRGHPYDQANTYINASGHRFCRACKRATYAAKRALEGRTVKKIDYPTTRALPRV